MNTETHQVQYGALPFRRRGEAIQILLITSRDTGRWIIPKGWPIAGLSPHDAAAREAHEEAGLVGSAGARAIGRYRYLKRRDDGSSVPCVVEVFALEVERQMRSWLEGDERRRRWFELQEAVEAVQEPELQELILRFGKGLRPANR